MADPRIKTWVAKAGGEGISKIKNAYASAVHLDTNTNWITTPEYYNKSTEYQDMDSSQIQESKKRTLTYIQAQELQWKLKSKHDFFQYLDKHRKYRYIPLLTPMQCNTTCRRPPPSTRTS